MSQSRTWFTVSESESKSCRVALRSKVTFWGRICCSWASVHTLKRMRQSTPTCAKVKKKMLKVCATGRGLCAKDSARKKQKGTWLCGRVCHGMRLDSHATAFTPGLWLSNSAICNETCLPRSRKNARVDTSSGLASSKDACARLWREIEPIALTRIQVVLRSCGNGECAG